MKWLWLSLLLTSFALAANPQDEQVVRNAYAKLAFAVQAHTVYFAVIRNPNLKSIELAQKLQDNELRFDISELSSGPLSDIASRPISDFVTQFDTQPILQITDDTETFTENGKRFTTYFADAAWSHQSQSQNEPDPPVNAHLSELGNFSRYVAATITVSFQGQSRRYHALWFFGSDIWASDLVVGAGGVLTDFLPKSLFPSVLTDTSLRSRVVVSNWLSSTQQLGSSCKIGKQDVCCDSATMHCGVNSEDLRSTKPAPNTTADTEEGGSRN